MVASNLGFDPINNIKSVSSIPLIVELNKSFNAGEIKFDYRTKLEFTFNDESKRVLEFTGDIVREKSEITQNLKIPTFSDDLWKMGEK